MSAVSGILYSWKINEGEITLSKSSAGNHFFSLKQADEKCSIITNVASFFNFERTHRESYEFLKLTYCRLVQLSDGSHKVYLHPRLMGGMMNPLDQERAIKLKIDDSNVTDEQVERNIISKLPPGIYDSIQVQHNDAFIFELDQSKTPKRVRIITFHIKALDRLWCYFQAVFSAVGIYDSLEETKEKYQRTLSLSAIQSALLGSDTERDRKELELAYSRASTFTLKISMDLTYIEIIPNLSSVRIVYDLLKGVRRILRSENTATYPRTSSFCLLV